MASFDGSSSSSKSSKQNIPSNEVFNFDDCPTQESQHMTTILEDQTIEAEERSGSKTPKSEIFTKHFTKEIDVNGKSQAKCNYCPKSYQYKMGDGYGKYHKHLRKFHPQELGIDNKQTQITGFATSNLSLFRFSEERHRNELAKMIAIEHLSFSFGEKLGFKKYCQNSLNPQFKNVPRTTLRRTLKNIYNQGKKELIQLFSNLDSRVSICSDIWSDHWQVHSYMAITCHWIDNEWNIQKRVLAFRIFDESHNALNIFKMISIILGEYGLCKKVFSIGFDNASANTASIGELRDLCQPGLGGKFFHIRCACHILNLAVQDGLRALENHIKPIRKAISYLWAHPKLMKKWSTFCKVNGKNPKRFSRDVPTRWNSTFELLKESHNYSELLCAFFATNMTEILLHENNWIVCNKILEILSVFNDATYTLSGVYYPTTHLFLTEACNIVGCLNEAKNDDFLKQPIREMFRKWTNYYEHIPHIYLVASVFDPRVRLDGLHEYLSSYYEQIYGSENYAHDVSKKVFEVKELICSLYNEFFITYGDRFPTSILEPSSNTDNSLKRAVKIGDRILLERSKRQKGSPNTNTELESYLTTKFEHDDSSLTKQFKVLDWWKRKSENYPILSLIAKQILATPASTVAVEQAFSAGGSILDETRSRLSPESLEIQACVDDWTRAEYRQQEMEKDEEEEFNYTTDSSAVASNEDD